MKNNVILLNACFLIFSILITFIMKGEHPVSEVNTLAFTTLGATLLVGNSIIIADTLVNILIELNKKK